MSTRSGLCYNVDKEDDVHYRYCSVCRAWIYLGWVKSYVIDGIVHPTKEENVHCSYCHRVWDGYAQCPCYDQWSESHGIIAGPKGLKLYYSQLIHSDLESDGSPL